MKFVVLWNKWSQPDRWNKIRMERREMSWDARKRGLRNGKDKELMGRKIEEGLE